MTTKAPAAFSGNDSSVYMAQAMAVADLLGTGNHRDCGNNTVREAGMLIFMLLTAASELDDAERAQIRANLAKQEAQA